MYKDLGQIEANKHLREVRGVSNFMNKDIASNLKSIGINSISDMLRLQLMSPEQLRLCLNRKLSKDIINTENLPYLEYHTPFEFLITVEENLKALLPYCDNDDTIVVNAPPKFFKELNRAQESYRASLNK